MPEPEEKAADPVVTEQPIVAAEPVIEAAPVVVEESKDATPPAPEAEAVPERVPSLLEAAEAPGQKDAEAAAAVDAAKAEPAKDAKVEEKTAEPVKEGEQPKPEEKAAEGEKKPDEVAAEPAKPEPIEYEYTVPEQIVMDDARRSQFKEVLDGFRADPKAGAQKLIDMHHQAMVDYDKQVRQSQWDAFANTKKSWEDQAKGDELIGGAGHQTAMAAIATVRNAFVSDHPFGSKEYKADMGRFHDALDATGAGSHPEILKMIYRMSRYLNEPSAPHVLDVKAPRDPNRRKGGDVLYDNDRSPSGRQ